MIKLKTENQEPIQKLKVSPCAPDMWHPLFCSCKHKTCEKPNSVTSEAVKKTKFWFRQLENIRRHHPQWPKTNHSVLHIRKMFSTSPVQSQQRSITEIIIEIACSGLSY